jgi:hypothetical protein
VEHGVLQGFSIGIKGARVVKSEVAPNGAIIDGQIIEVSLVDRPANPECLLQIAKSDEAGIVAPVEEQVLIEGPAAAEAVAPVGEPEVVVAAPQEPVTAPEAAPVMEAAQEVRARAADVLTALRAIYPAETAVEVKADESSDISNAQQAIAIIARLIQSEAEELANGDMGEAGDIDMLLSAVSALRWFIRSEQDEQQEDALGLADQPEEVKGDTPTDTPSTELSEEPVIIDSPTKADLPDGAVQAGAIETMVTKMVTEALAKVTESHEAALEALRDELAKVKSQPTPGGPVRVRTQIDKAAAADTDRAMLLADAARFEQQADAVTDRDLAEGYRRLAAQKRAQAAV